MTSSQSLRITTLLEGISLVVLVFVGMPLKYLAGMPLAVRIAGPIHGIFFLIFVFLLFKVAAEKRWPLRRSLLAIVAAVVPFGAFVLERSLRDETDRA